MLLSIDVASERPIYEQIADAARREIAHGALRSGDRLPSAGEIAVGLSVNKHTVLRAYQLLRDERLVDLRRGRGAVVTSLADELVRLRRDATRIAERARALGISGQALASLFAEAPLTEPERSHSEQSHSEQSAAETPLTEPPRTDPALVEVPGAMTPHLERSRP